MECICVYLQRNDSTTITISSSTLHSDQLTLNFYAIFHSFHINEESHLHNAYFQAWLKTLVDVNVK